MAKKVEGRKPIERKKRTFPKVGTEVNKAEEVAVAEETVEEEKAEEEEVDMRPDPEKEWFSLVKSSKDTPSESERPKVETCMKKPIPMQKVGGMFGFTWNGMTQD